MRRRLLSDHIGSFSEDSRHFFASGKWISLSRAAISGTVKIIICRRRRCRGRRRERDESVFRCQKFSECQVQRGGGATTYSFGVASFCIFGIYRPRTDDGLRCVLSGRRDGTTPRACIHGLRSRSVSCCCCINLTTFTTVKDGTRTGEAKQICLGLKFTTNVSRLGFICSLRNCKRNKILLFLTNPPKTVTGQKVACFLGAAAAAAALASPAARRVWPQP